MQRDVGEKEEMKMVEQRWMLWRDVKRENEGRVCERVERWRKLSGMQRDVAGKEEMEMVQQR